jgi:hypothetical protein
MRPKNAEDRKGQETTIATSTGARKGRMDAGKHRKKSTKLSEIENYTRRNEEADLLEL